MTRKFIIAIIGLIILIFFSCEREPDCLWCTVVTIAPEYGIIRGEGYACGQTLEIIQQGQYYRVDSVTGEVRLRVTHCGDKASVAMFFSEPFVVCGEMIYLYEISENAPVLMSETEKSWD